MTTYKDLTVKEKIAFDNITFILADFNKTDIIKMLRVLEERYKEVKGECWLK